jgi:voltage-gated potassium channel
MTIMDKKIMNGITISLLSGFSIAFIIILNSYQLSNNLANFIYIFDLIVSIILLVDFCKRIKESGEGHKYFLRHVYEIPSLIPLFFFVMLESEPYIGATMRSLRVVAIFRFLHMLSRTLRAFEGVNNRLVSTFVLTAATVMGGALSIYIIESNVEGTKIRTIGDAFWWAIVTFTTVGYGDVYPVTLEGKVIASALMILGITVLGLLISTFGGSLIESRIRSERKKEENNIKEMIKRKIDRLDSLERHEINALLSSISDLHTDIQAKATAAAAAMPEAGKAATVSIKCVNCGNLNPQDAIYCFRCGTSLDSSSNQKT